MNFYRRVVVLQHLLRRPRCLPTTAVLTTNPAAEREPPTLHHHHHHRNYNRIPLKLQKESFEVQREYVLQKRRNTPRHGLSDEDLDFKKKITSILDGGDLNTASDLLCQAFLSNNPERIQVACNALLKSMYDVGRYTEVESLYHFFFLNKNKYMEPCLMSQHILMDTYFATARPDHALQLFRSIYPDLSYWCRTSTANCVTKGLVSADRINEAVDIVHTLDVTSVDAHIYNNLIHGFLELHNDIQRANQLFREYLSLDIKESHMSHDAVIYATYMEYYFKRNMEKEAMETFQGLLDRNIKISPETGNLVLQVLLKYGKTLEANALFDDMLNARALNDESFNIMVNECFRLGKVFEALQIFNNRKGSDKNAHLFPMGSVGYNNMIAKLFDCGMVTEADEIFLEMLNFSDFMEEEKNKNSGKTDVTTFGILFDAYFKLERIDDVLKWFNFLLFETALNPNSGVVNSVFCRLINKGRIDEAGEILVKMLERGHLPLWYLQQLTTSYKVLLSQLCKGNKLEQVWDLLVQMARCNVAVTPNLFSMGHQAFGHDGFINQIGRLFQIPIETRDAVLKHALGSRSAPVVNY